MMIVIDIYIVFVNHFIFKLAVRCLSSFQNEPEKKRGTEKRVRSERDVVLETIFSAFEKHQYYTLKDLIGITQQPVVSIILQFIFPFYKKIISSSYQGGRKMLECNLQRLRNWCKNSKSEHSSELQVENPFYRKVPPRKKSLQFFQF